MKKIMTEITEHFKMNTINKKFSLSILFALIFLMMSYTIIDSKLKTSQGENEIKNIGNTLVKLASTSLQNPVWNFSQIGIKTAADALFKDNQVYSVVVKDSQGVELYSASSNNEILKNVKFITVNSDIENSGHKIGTVEVKLTSYFLNKKIQTEIIRHAVGSIIIIVLLLIIITIISRIITKPLKELVTVSEKISKGDFDARVNVTASDETGILSLRFNQMTQSICDNMSNLKNTSSKLEDFIKRLRDTNLVITEISSDLASSSQHLASAAQESNATIEEITSKATTVSEVVENLFEKISQTNNKSDKITEIAVHGTNVIEETAYKIDSISKSFGDISDRVQNLTNLSSEIKNFTNIIFDITQQTNLIALNAAIEAAKVGEAGRGFAVVADEIKKLSTQSSNATKEINQLIANINNSVNETVSSTERGSFEVKGGVDLIDKMKTALNEISTAIKDTILIIKEINDISKEADLGVKNVTIGCKDFVRVIENITISSQDLSNLANKLHKSSTYVD